METRRFLFAKNFHGIFRIEVEISVSMAGAGHKAGELTKNSIAIELHPPKLDRARFKIEINPQMAELSHQKPFLCPFTVRQTAPQLFHQLSPARPRNRHTKK